MKKPLIPFVAALFAILISPARANVLDNFNDNAKTGWTDFTFLPGFGSPQETGGQFKFNLPKAGQSIFAASTKSSETFTLQEGRTIVFSADLVAGNGGDSFALLSFIPKAAQVSELAGYSMAISTTDFLLTKGINKYFYDQSNSIKNENVTLVLTLSVKQGSVFINAKVLDKDDNNAVIFEQSAVDTPEPDVLGRGADSPQAPYLGEGNFVLMCYEDNGTTQDSYEVTFDNAETYVCDEVLVDNFDDNVKTQWQDFTFIPGFGAPEETGGQFQFNLPAAGQSIFAASTRTAPVFELSEGHRLQFKADLVSTNGNDAFAIVGFIPVTAEASQLAGYTLAKSSSDILITKGINKYFYNNNNPVKNENVTMVLTLTMKDGSVVINAQVLDMDNGNEVLFDFTAVDTPGVDVLQEGPDSPHAPYSGMGNYVLFGYEDDGNTQPSYEILFDNAVACRPPLAGNAAPVLSGNQPEAYSNFLPTSTLVSFKAADDKPLPDAGLSITLNGTVYTAANGLMLSGPADQRVVSIGGLQPNVNYSAVLRAADADGAVRSQTIAFDTFTSASFTIEAEDFNINGGAFWNCPVVIPEGSGPLDQAYAGQTGINGIDFYETRSDFNDVPYRPLDPVRMARTLDTQRTKFSDAGGIPLGVYDYDAGDYQPDEWMNYTRSFPAGTYDVFLRQSIVNMASYECVLEKVTGDRTRTDQSTVALGVFRGVLSGFRYGNTPLTGEGGANPIALHLEGVETLRLRQTGTVEAGASVLQNYLILIRRPEAAAFAITSISWDAGQRRATFSWPSETGHAYKVEASSDLQQWNTLAPAHPSQGSATSYTDSPPAGAVRQYYRVTR